jgi:formate dehydrogenase maturation protein FdhE
MNLNIKTLTAINQSKMDKSMIADVESLPEADKQRMANMIDQLEIRDRFPKSSSSSFFFFFFII